MSIRSFIVIFFILLLGAGGYIFARQRSSPEVILDREHAIQEATHIAQGEKHKTYNSHPASSGPHYFDATAPTPWGIYAQEVPEEVYVHNAEHGGVIIAYKPDLPADQLKKLRALFASPYSNKEFKPNRYVLIPSAKNTKAIQLASWGWTHELDQYDETAVKKFYLQHVGKAPEVGAGPNNAPINQADGQITPN